MGPEPASSSSITLEDNLVGDPPAKRARCSTVSFDVSPAPITDELFSRSTVSSRKTSVSFLQPATPYDLKAAAAGVEAHRKLKGQKAKIQQARAFETNLADVLSRAATKLAEYGAEDLAERCRKPSRPGAKSRASSPHRHRRGASPNRLGAISPPMFRIPSANLNLGPSRESIPSRVTTRSRSDRIEKSKSSLNTKLCEPVESVKINDATDGDDRSGRSLEDIETAMPAAIDALMLAIESLELDPAFAPITIFTDYTSSAVSSAIDEVRQLQRDTGFVAGRITSNMEKVTAPIDVLRGGKVVPVEQSFVGAVLAGRVKIVKHINTGGFGRGWEAVLLPSPDDPTASETPVFVKTFGTVDSAFGTRPRGIRTEMMLPSAGRSTTRSTTTASRATKSSSSAGIRFDTRPGTSWTTGAWSGHARGRTNKAWEMFEEQVQVEADIYMHPWFPLAVGHPGCADSRLCYGSVQFPPATENVGNIFFICGELCTGGDLWAYGNIDRSFPENVAKRIFGQLARGLMMMKNCGGRKQSTSENEREKKQTNTTDLFKMLQKRLPALQQQIPLGHNPVNGCFHRDLKLENLILTGDYDCKIVDFGSLKFTEYNEGDSCLEQTILEDGKIIFTDKCPRWVGTDEFRPPAYYYSSSPKNDPASWDVWATGVILLFLVAGDHIYNALGSAVYNLFQFAMKEAHPDWTAHGEAATEPDLYLAWHTLGIELMHLRAEQTLYRMTQSREVIIYTITPCEVGFESYLFSCLLGDHGCEHHMLEQMLPGSQFTVDKLPKKLGTSLYEVGTALLNHYCMKYGFDPNLVTLVDENTRPDEKEIDSTTSEWIKIARHKARELNIQRLGVQRKADRLDEHRLWIKHRRKFFLGENPFYDTDPHTGKPLKVDPVTGTPEIERNEDGTPIYKRFWRFMEECDPDGSGHRQQYTFCRKGTQASPLCGGHGCPTHVTNQPFSPELKDILSKMLDIDSRRRITIEEVCSHPWLKSHQAPDPNIAREYVETREQHTQFVAEMQKRTVEYANGAERSCTVECSLNLVASVERISQCLHVNGVRYSIEVFATEADDGAELQARINECDIKTVKHLRERLSAFGLPTAGRKAVLVERLARFLYSRDVKSDPPKDAAGTNVRLGKVNVNTTVTEVRKRDWKVSFDNEPDYLERDDDDDDDEEEYTLFSIEVYSNRWDVMWETSPLGAASLAEWHTFKAALRASVGGGVFNTIAELGRRKSVADSWRRVGAWTKTPSAAKDAGLRELFDLIDSDNSGLIDAPELMAALRTQGIDVPYEQIMEMINHGDRNADGMLSFEEFKDVMARIPD